MQSSANLVLLRHALLPDTPPGRLSWHAKNTSLNFPLIRLEQRAQMMWHSWIRL